MRLVFEYGSSPPISLDLCADDEDPSQLIIRPGWDAPHVRCFPRTFCARPCLLRQVGTVLGSPYDYVVARLAYANPGSRKNITQINTSKQLQVTTTLIIATLITYSCKTHNSVQQTNFLNQISMITQDFQK